ncbi:MAG: DUF2157 domain-containing protein [Sandaracinobacteroides sp.]
MSLDSRLDAWVLEGLIDAAAAERIRSHEALHERPRARWAIAGLGLLAVVLGIMLVISANWDRIPHGLKLGVHMALLAAAAATHWWAGRRDRPAIAEGALFLFAGLVLAGIALQAQVYQLTGPAWHALMLWLALAAPAILISGRTRLTGFALAAMALVGPAAMVADSFEKGGLWLWAQGGAMAVPALLLALSMVARNGPAFRLAHRGRPGFCLALRDSGLVAILAGASFAHFAWASNITAEQAADNAIRLVPAAIASLLALAIGRGRSTDLPHPLLLPVLAGAPIAFALALAIPHPDSTASRLVGVVIFLALWAAVARGAATAGMNSLFAVAIAAMGLRIFIIYIELFGSLAATGGGLIVGGGLLVGLSWLWHRIVSRRKAAQ